MYKFDHNWFGQNIQNLTHLFAGHTGTPKLEILEIGTFEGRSTVWFMDNVPKANITCIDTWKGGVDHDPNNPAINFKTVLSNFEHNIEPHKDRVTVITDTSWNACIDLHRQGKTYDFIYVDGSHTAIDVNSDLVLAWKVLKVGGLIYCDDYFWGFNQENLDQVPYLNSVYDSPKLGIDSFVNVYRNKLAPVIGMQNSAAVYIKTNE